MPRGEMVSLFGRRRKDFDPDERVIACGSPATFIGYPYDGDAWKYGNVRFDNGNEFTVPLADIVADESEASE
jgi:hypothetical protein